MELIIRARPVGSAPCPGARLIKARLFLLCPTTLLILSLRPLAVILLLLFSLLLKLAAQFLIVLPSYRRLLRGSRRGGAPQFLQYPIAASDVCTCFILYIIP